MERKELNGPVIRCDDQAGKTDGHRTLETLPPIETARKRSAELAHVLFEMGVEIAQARAKVAGMLRTTKARSAGAGR